MNNKLLWIILIVAALLLLLSRVTFKAEATNTPAPCGTETYEFSNEGSNTRVSVNVHGGDEEVDVTGLNGWTVTDLWLDQDGGGTNYVHFSGGNRTNFNPSNFGDIDKVKVTVQKVCPSSTPVPSPTPTPTPTVVPSPSPVPSPTPVVSPSPSPTPSPTPGCDGECVQPTPTPTPEPTTPPVFTQEPSAFMCPDGSVTILPGNFHVYRNGDTASLRWVPTAGNQVNVYWKNPKSADWEHSLRDSANDGIETVGGLGNHDWSFGLQQKANCGGGVISVVIDDNLPKLFRFSYLEVR